MASASSSAARLFIRDGKSAARLLFRVRAANLTENTGPGIRSLLRFNQTPASQYPVFSEIFPVMQSGFRVGGFVQQEAVSERIGNMEAAHGKRVVDNESSGSEEETDFDEDEIDDIDDDDEFDDDFEDEEDDDDDDNDKYTKKK